MVDIVGHVLDLRIIGLVGRSRSRGLKGRHGRETRDTRSRRSPRLDGVEGDERRSGDGGKARLQSAGRPGGQPS